MDITLITDLLTLTRIYMGDVSIVAAQTKGKIRLCGPSTLTRSMSSWFARSPFAKDNPLRPAAAAPASSRPNGIVSPRAGARG